MSDQDTTHFGFQRVAVNEKSRHVRAVFDSVANRYDLMNDVMSFGLHRLWKRYAVSTSGVRPGQKVLDIAGGSGDMAKLMQQRVGQQGQVILSDINAAMLQTGRDRLLNDGVILNSVQCDAQQLPFPDRYFDCVSVAFGLRNMTHKDQALREMCRVLKPGGKLIVLEFSRIWQPLQPLYDRYSFGLLPKLGQWLAKDAASYRYLAESIRMHPDQQTLKQMMQQAGFDQVEYQNLNAGVVALHKGYKY